MVCVPHPLTKIPVQPRKMFVFRNLANAIPSTFAFRGAKPDDQLPGETAPNWWKDCTCYQVWPASFKDDNGDGLGDIPGLLTKLDYLHDLGVNVIWLSPMYASPQVDMGYDISDYEAVYPPYGTMEDMDKLIKGLHDRGMRLILDLVINHTSDQHAWFQDSRRDRTNERSDWYIWKDAKIVDGTREPPNNWGAIFGGSAWEYCPERDQFYLHMFTKAQPDLNWENESARKAIYQSALRFWLEEKQVDGFRVDTANLYSKVQTFPDGAVAPRLAPYGDATPYVLNGPRIHEFYKEIRSQVLDHFGDPMMVGELPGTSFDGILDFVSSDAHELSMVFDFDVVKLGGAFMAPKHEITGYRLPELKTALKKTQDLTANTKGWSTIFAENHDLPRSVSRHALSRDGPTDPKYHDKAAKVLAMLLGTLSGTLFVYQGQEIGMTNIPESWGPEDLRDIAAINYWNDMKARYPGDREILRRAWLGIVAVGRDNARTPVQWSGEPHAGFTTGKPWMRVNDNYKEINVAAQIDNKNSILTFWKRMLKLRREHADMFVHGQYLVHDHDNLNTYTYEKDSAGSSSSAALVMLNFSTEECVAEVPAAFQDRKLDLLVSNVAEPSEKLSPWEGRVYIASGRSYVWSRQ